MATACGHASVDEDCDVQREEDEDSEEEEESDEDFETMKLILSRLARDGKLKPSTVVEFPWLCTRNAMKQKLPSPNFDPKTCVETAEKLFKELTDSGRRITERDICEIAQQVSYLSGKWLVYRDSHIIDETWEKVAKAVRENKLGPSAKVSTADPEESYDGVHVICVYTEDYTDAADVYRVLAELREIGIGGNLKYKPDIYTILGIYRRNPWRIRPTVYMSNKPGT